MSREREIGNVRAGDFVHLDSRCRLFGMKVRAGISVRWPLLSALRLYHA